MGLTIHYTVRAPPRPVADARRLVEQLRGRAMDLPFERVGDLLDLSGAACDYAAREPDDPDRWLLTQASRPVHHGGRSYHVPPARLLVFAAFPGSGSEPVNVGLCRYPGAVAGPGGRRVRTGIAPGWHWSSFCKTQYASNPTAGDTEHFVRCHLSVVRLLDRAAELGVLHAVSDEGGYWAGRDVRALVETVTEWNRAIAAFVGGMKDLLGGRDVASPITTYPNYERLEAEGRADDGRAGP